MKNIRFVLCTLFFVLCPFVASQAVDIPKQGFGLQIGWAQPVLRINEPGNVATKDSLSRNIHLNGFKVGLIYDASYVAGFGSSMGINYTFGVSNSGWEKTYPNSDLHHNRTLITYHELELFVDWQYKFEIAKETYLMLYTGPTIQLGAELNMRRDTKEENFNTGEVTLTYGDRSCAYTTDKNDEAMKRINVTWGVGAGFQYKRYFLRGGYDFGLIVPYKNADFENGDYHTRGRLDQWAVKIGMYLWYAD